MEPARLKAQSDFIQRKLATCKLFDKYGLTLVDSDDVIIKSLMGELRNIVLAFFKGGMFAVKKCEFCNATDAPQFERAHHRGTSRADVAVAALNRIRPDKAQPVKQADFIRAFIEEHTKVPLHILCKACHTKYDRADSPERMPFTEPIDSD
jgi:hypothetical protein